MSKAKPKVEPVEEVVEVKPPVPPTELEAAKERQAFLLGLRDVLVREGITDVAKLDALLSKVNKRVEELS